MIYFHYPYRGFRCWKREEGASVFGDESGPTADITMQVLQHNINARKFLRSESAVVLSFVNSDLPT